MTPAALAARIAAERARWARFAKGDPALARIERRSADHLGIASRYDDPPIGVRASDLEQILADAHVLAVVAESVDDLDDVERAAMRRHLGDA